MGTDGGGTAPGMPGGRPCHVLAISPVTGRGLDRSVSSMARPVLLRVPTMSTPASLAVVAAPPASARLPPASASDCSVRLLTVTRLSRSFERAHPGRAVLGPASGAVAALAEGEELVVLAPFEPVPLEGVLSSQGFTYEVAESGGTWRVPFRGPS